ncbi:MAG: glucose-1-phosphate adenylyltransferase [Gammaproteobacteria bacterium]|jgi:glucose-1-phosphate adenylyltransferase|nr:glucose-1-phosphate adenylyltransferase [Gammaproteobacteria bacterium]
MTAKSARFVSRLTRSTLALILAGGRGSRLQMLTDWRAKPAVPFAGKFRIIDFALSNCVHSGVRRISVLTQYKSHSLIRHLMEGWNGLPGEFGEFVELIPAQQWLEDESWYQGTADAVYQSLDIIEAHAPEFVLVLAGDHVYKMDYGEMLAAHVASGADLTVACNRVSLEEASGFGVMSVDSENRILAFEEKPAHPTPLPDSPDKALASMGIYVFSREYLARELRRDAALSESDHDFGKDIIPNAVATGHRVQAYPFGGGPGGDYWRDVGTVDAFYGANLELTGSNPPLDLYDPDWPIFTYQPQLPSARFTDHGPSHGCRMIDAIASGGCVITESEVQESILFSNVRIGRGCKLDGVLALPDVSVGEGCRLKRVILDNGCRVPAGTVIGEDAEEDARRFYRTEQGVVVVNRDMLGQEHQYQPATTLYDPGVSSAR